MKCESILIVHLSSNSAVFLMWLCDSTSTDHIGEGLWTSFLARQLAIYFIVGVLRVVLSWQGGLILEHVMHVVHCFQNHQPTPLGPSCVVQAIMNALKNLLPSATPDVVTNLYWEGAGA